MVKIIDLKFQNESNVIAAFLMETSAGPVLIETGPHSTINTLAEGLDHHGYKITDIQHVFLTHIHLDHAGAAWVFANHGAKIYLHPLGVPHLSNPERLYASAKRIYGDTMESLWGDFKPIPEAQLRGVRDNEKIMIGDLAIRGRKTPGHAIHHIAWEVKDFAFTGDVAGVRIRENGPAMPPCPPPDINVSSWIKSMEYLRARRYDKIFLTHFGMVSQVKNHFIELEGRLLNWANWIKPFWENGVDAAEITPLFGKYVMRQLENSKVTKEDIHRYDLANPLEMSVSGLLRYWDKEAIGT